MFSFNLYLQSNKQKLFNDLEIIKNGSLSFENGALDIYSNFPSVTFTINNVEINDKGNPISRSPVAVFKEAKLSASVEKLLDNEIEIIALECTDGSINLSLDSLNNSSLLNIFDNSNSNSAESTKSKFKIKSEHLKIKLFNVAFNYKNEIEKRNVKTNINDLECKLNLSDEKNRADIKFNVSIDSLELKKGKGVYLHNSRVSGKTQIQLEDQHFTFLPFDLRVNDELFSLNGDYYLDGSGTSFMTFENDFTNFEKTLKILPNRLKEKLIRYKTPNPFYSKTKISGSFLPGDNPLVEVDFKMKNNRLDFLIVGEPYKFENAYVEGKFLNRIYDDERADKEDKRNVRIILDTINLMYDEFNVRTTDALILSTPEDELTVKTKAYIKGDTKGISNWLENDQFYFNEGEFDLFVDINSPILEKDSLIIKSNANLSLSNFSVLYKPANVSFPFKKLKLTKKAGDAKFSISSSTMQKGHNYNVSGGLEQLPALLLDLKDEQTKSTVDVYANKLGWADFLDLFGENGYLKSKKPKTDRQKKKSMKEVFKGIHHNFQPNLSIKVDTLVYDENVQLHNFETGIHYDNEHTLILENTKFNYLDGFVQFNGKLDISDSFETPFELELTSKNINLQELLPKVNYFDIAILRNLDELPNDVELNIKHKGIIDDQKGLIPNTSKGEVEFVINQGEALKGKIYIQPDMNVVNAEKTFVNTRMKLEGDPSLLNNFFKTDQFFFSKGRFYVDSDFSGEVASISQLLNKTNATFELKNSEVYYKDADIVFPLTQINMKLANDNADFDFYLNSKKYRQQITINGDIQNLSELLIGKTGKEISTNAKIRSPKLTWDNFLYIFAPVGADKSKSHKKSEGLKKTIRGVLTEFNPTVSMKLDTFVYSDQFFVEKFETGLHLSNFDELVLQRTAFEFHDGRVEVDGKIDISERAITPFKTKFRTEKLDLALLIRSLDYLSLPALKNIKKLSGKITLDFDFEGVLQEDGKGLLTESTYGNLNFDLHEVELKGFGPLDSIAAKINREERFGNLKFAPISSSITIKGEDLTFPMMEVQSNAINIFAEGVMSFGNNTNIWISIPIDNLKSRDSSIIPEKRGYASVRNKVFVEVDADDDGENRFKFHLSKRKFYQDRGILDQFREDKNELKQKRRELKKSMKSR